MVKYDSIYHVRCWVRESDSLCDALDKFRKEYNAFQQDPDLEIQDGTVRKLTFRFCQAEWEICLINAGSHNRVYGVRLI